MKKVLLVISLSSALTIATASLVQAQPYLNGAPPGGVGTYSNRPSAAPDDPRFRGDNWRDSAPDNWRSNNWREDRTEGWGTWRRNNWRADRYDDSRPYRLRDGEEKKEDATADRKKSLEGEAKSEDCRTIRNRPGIYSENYRDLKR